MNITSIELDQLPRKPPVSVLRQERCHPNLKF
jgi:hypothetical protein